MVKTSELKRLPNMEYRFNLQSKGDDSGINWVGDFVYKRPSIGSRSQIEVLHTRMNGDLATLDPSVQDINYSLAHLRYTLIEYPEWWRDSDWGVNLYDINIIMEIYSECLKFEREWKEKFHGNGKSDDKNDSIESGEESDTESSTSYKRSED